MENQNQNPNPLPNSVPIETDLSRRKRFWRWVKIHIYDILYVTLLIGLWIYLIINWDKCISMEFFDRFNGNNILFLVGIAMVISFFYDVEAKDFKFHRRTNRNMGMQFQNAEYSYNNTQANISSVQVTNNENEEENINE